PRARSGGALQRGSDERDPAAGRTRLYGVSRRERMGRGAPKSGGLRKTHGAPQAGEGQELERFVRSAPPVLVVLVRKARLARHRRRERCLARKERRDAAAQCEAVRVPELANLVESRREAGLLMHLARRRLERTLAGFDAAGKDLPEPAPLGAPLEQEHASVLALQRHADRLQL